MRTRGIGPRPAAWEAAILPLNYVRKLFTFDNKVSVWAWEALVLPLNQSRFFTNSSRFFATTFYRVWLFGW